MKSNVFTWWLRIQRQFSHAMHILPHFPFNGLQDNHYVRFVCIYTVYVNIHKFVCMEGTWGHVAMQCKQGECQLCTNCFMRWMLASNRDPEFHIHLSPPTAKASVLTTRPRPIRQIRIGTGCMVLHTGHNSESILARYDSPPGAEL